MESTSAYVNSIGTNVLVVNEPTSHGSILDSLRINPRPNTLDCLRFDGYNFLGWQMKIEQFFEVVKIREEEKVHMVMIHLEGMTLQWHQRLMGTKSPL